MQNNNKLYLTLLFYILANIMSSQSLRMIDNLNISDLSAVDNYTPLDSSIKDKRIILLGESAHITKEYSLAKLKLIKYLHEKHGYNVILFESGIADCYYADQLKSKKDSSWLLTHSIFSIWWSKETLTLMDYIKKNNIKLSGIDYQLSSSANSDFLKLLEPLDSIFIRKIYSYDTAFSNYAYMQTFTPVFQGEKYNSIKTISQELIQNYGKIKIIIDQNNKVDLRSKLIINRIILNKLFLLNNFDIPNKVFTLRDSVMSSNIAWFCDSLYKGQKIIIWGANEHISKGRSPGFAHLYSGAILPDRIKNESYAMGIYAYSGEMYAYPENFTIKTPSPKSLEGRIHSIKNQGKDVFVDLTNVRNNANYSWVNKKIKSYSWGNYIDYITPIEFYDGIILINKVTLNRNYKTN